MKRIRIWLNSFTLMQQFVSIALVTTAFIVLFFLSFYSRNINSFVDTQMFAYLHRSQRAFLVYRENYETYSDGNVQHFVYSHITDSYLNDISGNEYLLEQIVPGAEENPEDLTLVDEEGHTIVCSVVGFSDGNYSLVSILSEAYRNDFKGALLEVVINTVLFLLFGLFIFFMIWVITLIRPLNQIRNYINKIKTGEDAILKIKRQDEIGEVAEAIQNMHDELEKQQRIREEMIQNISHDLKTPIATIKSYSESIKDGVYPYDTLEKSVDVISEHADRLEKKVFSLITYNKMGYLTDNAGEGDDLYMPDIISKAILSCRVLRNDIRIDTEIDDDVYFHGEEEPWRVVVENLLDNSLRYAKSLVRITLQEDLLEVFNDGELMPKDRLEKLFKPYEKGTKGNFGLGLSIVKKVTETYGYLVTGENMDDGVVFRVWRSSKPRRSSKKKE